MDGVVGGDDHYSHSSGSVPRLVFAQFGIEGRKDLDAPDIDTGSAQGNRLEIGGADQAVSMLQIAGDLFLAVAHRLRIGTPPGADWIIHLHAPGQCRAAINCPCSYIARRANAILITSPHNCTEGRACTTCAVSEPYQ